MRKINTRHFALATRQTPRDVNRLIALNLIREFGPISRAELARKMEIRRGAMTVIMRELLEKKLIEEKPAESVVRGRRPTLLSIRASGRLIAAVDVRPQTTFLALVDKIGNFVARSSAETPADPETLAKVIDTGLRELVGPMGPEETLKDRIFRVGVVMPGMIDRKTGRLIYSPRMGWRDVDLREIVAKQLGIKTYIESAPIACALARLWLEPEQTRNVNSFAYVHVSDGIGVGLVINGEALRGETNSAGEFGHVVLEPGGPECVCGKRGCWEALAANSATVSRYLGRTSANGKGQRIDIREVVRRANVGEEGAIEAVLASAEYIGRGLSLVVSAFNPGRIFLGGEIVRAWELLEKPIRAALDEGGILDAARRTPVIPDSRPGVQRLRGAAALVNAPSFVALTLG